ncbi:MAG: hypothetical protein ABR600_06315 [Actinomycetota bacterium]
MNPPARTSIFRLARYLGVGMLVLAAWPTLAGAAESMKDVFVTNTTANPVPVRGLGTQQVAGSVQVSNFPAVQSVQGSVEVSNLPSGHALRHGDGVATNNGQTNAVLPNDLVLTDLVVTYLGGNDSICEAALVEQTGTQNQGVLWFYPGIDNKTEQFHFQSGITRTADGWYVGTNSDCNLRVFWSGYTAP